MQAEGQLCAQAWGTCKPERRRCAGTLEVKMGVVGGASWGQITWGLSGGKVLATQEQGFAVWKDGPGPDMSGGARNRSGRLCSRLETVVAAGMESVRTSGCGDRTPNLWLIRWWSCVSTWVGRRRKSLWDFLNGEGDDFFFLSSKLRV